VDATFGVVVRASQSPFECLSSTSCVVAFGSNGDAQVVDSLDHRDGLLRNTARAVLSPRAIRTRSPPLGTVTAVVLSIDTTRRIAGYAALTALLEALENAQPQDEDAKPPDRDAVVCRALFGCRGRVCSVARRPRRAAVLAATSPRDSLSRGADRALFASRSRRVRRQPGLGVS
jgi:hypothetical protein